MSLTPQGRCGFARRKNRSRSSLASVDMSKSKKRLSFCEYVSSLCSICSLGEKAQAQGGGCVGSVSAWRRGADEVWVVREVAVVDGAACACGGGGDVSMGMRPL